MTEHKGRAGWVERLREKRRQRQAKTAASIHANQGTESGLERTRREMGRSKGGFGGDGGAGL